MNSWRLNWPAAILYGYSAGAAGVLVTIAQEDAYKYMNPYVLFWLKIWFAFTSPAAAAMKAFFDNPKKDVDIPPKPQEIQKP